MALPSALLSFMAWRLLGLLIWANGCVGREDAWMEQRWLPPYITEARGGTEARRSYAALPPLTRDSNSFFGF